jgi:hypothetical protein
MSVESRIFGTDLFGDPIRQASAGPLADRFLVPPFSVLNAREGDWQERKRAWLALGIKSEVGRGACVPNGTERPPEQDGAFLRFGENGASIFDPVLCELVYRWFCPRGGIVVDPFAGGSVRGVVASCVGLHYWGVELRNEQVFANVQQGNEICVAPMPAWICGDSMETLPVAPPADLVFSCPPYGDLEKYSDDPRDLSAMEWHTFTAAYKRIILRAAKALKNDRFACFVVGDFRDSKGHYRNFVGETVNAFSECGLHLYNEAIFVTPAGSLPVRIGKQFEAGRKLGKTHQNVLVFVKGDWRRAAQACQATTA